MAGVFKSFKEDTKLMGLKPIRFVYRYGFRTIAKMWFQLKDDLIGMHIGGQTDRRTRKQTSDLQAVVVLLFYVHGKYLRSSWDGQLT